MRQRCPEGKNSKFSFFESRAMPVKLSTHGVIDLETLYTIVGFHSKVFSLAQLIPPDLTLSKISRPRLHVSPGAI